jgi:hypothetical protein
MKASLVRDGSGRLWCLWQTARTSAPDIYACWWNGTSWSAPANLTGDAAIDEWPATTVDAAGRPWVSWTRRTAGRSEIRARYYDGTWQDAGIPSAGRGHAMRPTVAATANGEIWVAWADFSGETGAIYCAVREGTNWSTPALISTGLDLCTKPAMVTDDHNRPFLAWQVADSAGTGLAFSSCIEGVGWHPPVFLTGTASCNLNPVVAPDSVGVRLAWQGYSPGGNWEIYSSDVPLTGIAAPAEPAAPARALAAWPSVTRGPVRFSLPAPATQPLGIYDRAGRLALSVPTGNGSIVSVDLSDLEPGVYFARAGIASARFTVCR